MRDEQYWTAEDDRELAQDLDEQYEHDDPPLALRSPPLPTSLLRERLRALAAAGASGGWTPWGTLTREDGSAMDAADVEQLARELEEDREDDEC